MKLSNMGSARQRILLALHDCAGHNRTVLLNALLQPVGPVDLLDNFHRVRGKLKRVISRHHFLVISQVSMKSGVWGIGKKREAGRFGPGKTEEEVMRTAFSGLVRMVVAAMLLAMAVAGYAQADARDRNEGACAITCYAGVSAYWTLPEQPVQFTGVAVPAGCTSPVQYLWTFGDGASSTDQDPAHSYPDPGFYGKDFDWTFTASADGATCTRSGRVNVARTNFGCSAAAPYTPGPPPLTVNFTGTSTCSDYGYNGWDFGDGATAEGMNASHTYTQGGVYKWTFSTWAYALGDCWSCASAGDIIVVSNCIQVGDLSICGQSLGKDPAQNIYTLSGNVNINGMLFFSADSVFTGDPATGHGTLATDGDVFVKLKHDSKETLLKGPGLSFDVDGAAGTLTPKLTGTQWAASLAGLPLLVSGTPITLETDGVKIEPTLYIGNAALTLASFKGNILYVSGGQKTLLGFELIEGQLSPGIQFFGMSGVYDPDTDIFTGSVSVGFPFMGTWSVSATIRIKPSCSADGAGLNGFDIAIGLPDPIPLGTTGLGLAGFTLKVDNICDVPKFFIFIGGDLGIAEVPGEVFTLSQVGVGYQRPYLMVLEGGTANLLGFPVGNLSGRISFKPHFAGVTFKGWTDLAGIYQSNVSGFLSVSKKTIAGGSLGTLQVPDFSCSWYNAPCRAVKTALTSAVTLPLTLNAVDMDMLISPGQNGWQGMFRGMQKIGPLSLAVVLQYDNEDFSLLVGPNYADVVGLGLAKAALAKTSAERSFTLATPQRQALFAVAANDPSVALPAIYLKTPSGATITPADVGSHPDVHYAADNSLKVALFRVDEAIAGTWTLGVTNLADADVTFQCLAPTPTPTTTFTAVGVTAGEVSIQASVRPASSLTKVSLFVSDLADGGMGEPIAENLSAASGTVSAVWNAQGVTGGTYYLFARTDDGKNPPVITYYANPLQIGSGAIKPPTNLTGSFSGTVCQLQWTAPPSAGVKGYRILYTDSPALPGYPFGVTAPAGTGARVEGLRAGGKYRFAVVAFDGAGNESAPSSPGIPALLRLSTYASSRAASL